MIKKARIIESYHINLYCDDCGSAMVPKKEKHVSFDIATDKMSFNYVCPNCGKEEASEKLFPITQVRFDTGSAEVIQMEEIE